MGKGYKEIDAMLTASGQPFEIEQIEVNGANIKNWKNAPQSMAAILEQSLIHGDKEFIIYQGERLTFAEHYKAVAAVADQLINRFGIKKGDRIAIAMRNYPEWLIAFWAAASAGAIVVPLNAWWTSDELEYGLNDSSTQLIFVDQERLKRLRAIKASLPLRHVVLVRGDNIPDGIVDFQSLIGGAAENLTLPTLDIQPDDNATLFYTSGTTGFPKGTLGTHRNFCSAAMSMPYNGLQSVLRMGGTLEDLEAMKQMPHASLLTVPLFHVTGCHGIMLSMLTMGGKLVIMYKWEPEKALDLIEEEKITMFSGVPTMVWQLLDAPSIAQRDLSSLLNLAYGGAPAPPELLKKIISSIPEAGTTNGWGITEASSAITSIGGEDYIRKPDSVGPPLAVCEVKVVDEKGNELATNQQGELWVRGPNIVKGYWNKSEATAESFSDGWFHTGDVGKIDEEGFVYILDRLKDMIIRGGENVYCAEVEAALVEHPKVNAACVFGVPHRVLGEEVAAVVEIAPTDDLTEEDLQTHVARSIAKFKIPTKIWFHTETLPVGATGKVQKKELKARYIEELNAEK